MSETKLVSVCITDRIGQDAVYPIRGGEIYRIDHVRLVGAINFERPDWYVGFSTPPAPKLWRVVAEPRGMVELSAEVLDVEFQTREAAIVYAVMLMGSE